MKPAPFAYHDPVSVAEVLEILRSHENARLLAGGQSLLPMMNMRYAQPDHIIDINKIQGLSYIQERDGMIEIGAMTRQREIEFSPLIADKCPVLRDALLHVGHRQTRNRGTIGGSLCHLDPAAEQVLIAALYDATLVIAGSGGRRELRFADFALGFMTHAVQPDEMLTAVKFPVWPGQTRHAFQECARRHGDFAMAAVATAVTLDGRGRIERIALAVGGVTAVPLRMMRAEEMLVNQVPTAALIAEAAATCGDLEDALDDVHAPASYRKHIASVLTRRVLSVAAQRPPAGQ